MMYSIDAVDTLLQGAVSGDVMHSWHDAALWLSPSKTVKCFDSCMKYGETSCTENALSMFVGKHMSLPAGYTTREVCTAAAGAGSVLNVVWHAPLPSHAMLFATVKDETGQKGKAGCLLPVRMGVAGADPVQERLPAMVTILETGASKLLLIMYNEKLYPNGHCIVLQKARGRWYLSDPHMPSTVCLLMPPGIEHMLLLMCSASTILANVSPK